MNGDALSDLVLALIALGVAHRQLRTRPALAIGSGLIGLAAAVGVLRYSGSEFASLVLGPHRFLSLLAACAGFPLLALAVRWPDDPIAQRVTAAGRFVLISGAIGVALTLAGVDFWRQALPLASVLMIILTTWSHPDKASVLGAAALVASLGIAGGSTAGLHLPGPISSLQWMHYFMAMGLAALSLVKPGRVPAKH